MSDVLHGSRRVLRVFQSTQAQAQVVGAESSAERHPSFCADKKKACSSESNDASNEFVKRILECGTSARPIIFTYTGAAVQMRLLLSVSAAVGDVDCDSMCVSSRGHGFNQSQRSFSICTFRA